jgi:hypothetical protein
MNSRQATSIASALILLTAVSACDNATDDGMPDARQTDFPGQITAGGGTSGEVMTKVGVLQPRKDANSSPILVVIPPEVVAAPTAPTIAGTSGPKPSGTPGIPEGAGGTTSGPAMGGTTPAAAGTQKMSGVETGTAELDQAAKAAKEKELMAKEKQQLEAAMERIAARWRAQASARGWQIDGADPAQTSGVSALGETQTSAIGLPAIVRSEKLGTAPPSEDVKQPARDPSN